MTVNQMVKNGAFLPLSFQGETEVCPFWDFLLVALAQKGFDAKGKSCVLLSGLNVNSSQSMHSQHLAWRFRPFIAKGCILVLQHQTL